MVRRCDRVVKPKVMTGGSPGSGPHARISGRISLWSADSLLTRNDALGYSRRNSVSIPLVAVLVAT